MRKNAIRLKIKVIGIIAILIVLSCTPALTADILNNNDTWELSSLCFYGDKWKSL